MTVPKFRVFVKELSKMFLPEDIVYIDYSEKTVTVRGCNHSDCDTCYDEYDWEQCEIMRFTDILDDSEPRKGIFEGDVVTFEDADDIENVYINVGSIEWCQGGFTVTNRTTVTMEDLLDGDNLEVTIIGNIYEHPHLVEGLND